MFFNSSATFCQGRSSRENVLRHSGSSMRQIRCLSQATPDRVNAGLYGAHKASRLGSQGWTGARWPDGRSLVVFGVTWGWVVFFSSSSQWPPSLPTFLSQRKPPGILWKQFFYFPKLFSIVVVFTNVSSKGQTAVSPCAVLFWRWG